MKYRNTLRTLPLWAAIMATLLIRPACGGSDSYDGDVYNGSDTLSGTDSTTVENDVKVPPACLDYAIKGCGNPQPDPIAEQDSPDATTPEQEVTDEVTTTDPCGPAQIASGNWQEKDDDTIVIFSQFVENPYDNSQCYTKTENFGINFFVKKGEWTSFVGPSYDDPQVTGTVNDDEFVFQGPLIGDTPLVLVRP